PRDQVATDAHAVDLLEVRGDVTRGEPAAVEREDLVIKPLKAALALADDLRLKAPVPVPGSVDPDRPMLADQRLGRHPVALASSAARRLLVRLRSDVGGQLHPPPALAHAPG